MAATLNTRFLSKSPETLDNSSAAGRETVVSCSSVCRGTPPSVTPVQIVQITRETQEAKDILEEYYEAVNVVVRDKPGAIQRIMEEPASGMWLAYLNGQVVGCVVLSCLGSVPKASECKRLYVKPCARGHHIADRMLDAQEQYARSQSVEWIYLDTYDDLKVAIALYQRRGYESCERYNNNPQATLFMRKAIIDPPASSK